MDQKHCSSCVEAFIPRHDLMPKYSSLNRLLKFLEVNLTLPKMNWKAISQLLICSYNYNTHLTLYTGCGRKKWTPKFFRRFLSNRLGFWHEILQLYLRKPSTSNCQVKFDSVKKRRSYRLFNMTAYRFFSIQKCSGYNTNLITSLKQHG